MNGILDDIRESKSMPVIKGDPDISGIPFFWARAFNKALIRCIAWLICHYIMQNPSIL